MQRVELDLSLSTTLYGKILKSLSAVALEDIGTIAGPLAMIRYLVCRSTTIVESKKIP